MAYWAPRSLGGLWINNFQSDTSSDLFWNYLETLPNLCKRDVKSILPYLISLGWIWSIYIYELIIMQEECKYLSHTCSVNPWNPKNHIPRYHECIKGIFQPWFSDILYNVQILTNVNYQIFERAFCVPSSSVCRRMHKLKLERSCIKHIFPGEGPCTHSIEHFSNKY